MDQIFIWSPQFNEENAHVGDLDLLLNLHLFYVSYPTRSECRGTCVHLTPDDWCKTSLKCIESYQPNSSSYKENKTSYGKFDYTHDIFVKSRLFSQIFYLPRDQITSLDY